MRCYIEPSEWGNDEVTLAREEAHHLVQVMRARPDQSVSIFNGCGGTGEARVVSTARNRACLQILRREVHARPAVRLCLVQALIREQKMDFVIQKAVEIGVAEIIPVAVENAVVKISGDKAAAKKERWDRIALGAAKQCGCAWLPEIQPPQALENLLADRPDWDLLLVGSLEDGARPLRDILITGGSAPRSIAAVIGPEGDLSAAELTALRGAGATPVSLGDRVLRAETAAIYMLSALNYVYGN